MDAAVEEEKTGDTKTKMTLLGNMIDKAD